MLQAIPMCTKSCKDSQARSLDTLMKVLDAVCCTVHAHRSDGLGKKKVSAWARATRVPSNQQLWGPTNGVVTSEAKVAECNLSAGNEVVNAHG